MKCTNIYLGGHIFFKIKGNWSDPIRHLRTHEEKVEEGGNNMLQSILIHYWNVSNIFVCKVTTNSSSKTLSKARICQNSKTVLETVIKIYGVCKFKTLSRVPVFLRHAFWSIITVLAFVGGPGERSTLSTYQSRTTFAFWKCDKKLRLACSGIADRTRNLWPLFIKVYLSYLKVLLSFHLQYFCAYRGIVLLLFWHAMVKGEVTLTYVCIANFREMFYRVITNVATYSVRSLKGI